MSDDEDLDEDEELDEEEDGDDDDDDDDDDDGPGHEYQFDEETEGMIVAGKAFEMSGFVRRELGAFAAFVDQVAAKIGIPIAAIPAGDHSNTGPGPDDGSYGVLHVGVIGPRGGTYSPDQISREAALRALETVRGVPADVWATIGEKLGARERERYDEAEIGLHFTCVGPLAAATLAYGVPGEEDDDGPGEYIYGVDMDQEPHEDGIWGQKVAYVQYESPESEPLDLSDEAHKALVEELDEPNGEYFIIARYD